VIYTSACVVCGGWSIECAESFDLVGPDGECARCGPLNRLTWCKRCGSLNSFDDKRGLDAARMPAMSDDLVGAA